MTVMDDRRTEEPNEETALLSQQGKEDPKPTPLPRAQISALMLLQLAEPITSQCIYPFINQLVSELDITGGDERKVGYYAGLIQSIFFATEAIFVLQWSMLSDRIGRKPVLLTGMAGLCISMIFFGLSRTFWGLVLSRSLVGMLNGNAGVMKSMLAELTDDTNMAQAFSLLPIVWSVGGTLGPFMGGTLARPADRWPHIFTHQFWHDYPYFLPCAAASIFSALVFFLVLIFLKETVQTSSTKHKLEDPEPATGLVDPILHEHVPTIPDHPLPLRSLMIRPVLIAVGSYGLLALLDIAYFATLPLFYSTPIEYGGLGQTPASIGVILGCSGLINGTFQISFFASIVKRFGPKRVFMFGMSSFMALFSIFPITNHLARQQGMSLTVWCMVAAQLLVAIFMELSYGCIFMFITAAAPNKRSLGTTNGIGQVLASVLRAIGPASVTSLFALSQERNWLGGYAVFAIMVVISFSSLFFCDLLPEEVRTRKDDQ